MGVTICWLEYTHRDESYRPNRPSYRAGFAFGRSSTPASRTALIEPRECGAGSAVPIYRLTSELGFPDPEEADPSGLLAVGGDLGSERLLLAYSMGIFPWYEDGLPILWHSPDPRMILLPGQLRVSRSLRKTLRDQSFEIRLDGDFEAVIRACARAPRDGQDGTWITDEMIDAYLRLFELGCAHSAEAWLGAELVGVASADAFDGAPAGHHPRNLLRRARSVVVMGARLLDGAFELAPSRQYSITYQVANLELDRIAFHQSGQ